jgi:hypothetical protein
MVRCHWVHIWHHIPNSWIRFSIRSLLSIFFRLFLQIDIQTRNYRNIVSFFQTRNNHLPSEYEYERYEWVTTGVVGFMSIVPYILQRLILWSVFLFVSNKWTTERYCPHSRRLLHWQFYYSSSKNAVFHESMFLRYCQCSKLPFFSSVTSVPLIHYSSYNDGAQFLSLMSMEICSDDMVYVRIIVYISHRLL